MKTIPIHLIEADGRVHDLQGKPGQSLMRAAVDAGIEGIKADCGGLMTCATCHVYIVDFFTAKASPRTTDRLDRFGALLLALVMALLAWRTTLGGINAWKSGSGTMLIGFPEWVIYVVMVPPLALTAAIGLLQAWRGFPPPIKE